MDQEEGTVPGAYFHGADVIKLVEILSSAAEYCVGLSCILGPWLWIDCIRTTSHFPSH